MKSILVTSYFYVLCPSITEKVQFAVNCDRPQNFCNNRVKPFNGFNIYCVNIFCRFYDSIYELFVKVFQSMMPFSTSIKLAGWLWCGVYCLLLCRCGRVSHWLYINTLWCWLYARKTTSIRINIYIYCQWVIVVYEMMTIHFIEYTYIFTSLCVYVAS